jgi:plasmid stabilization system protein ParE
MQPSQKKPRRSPRKGSDLARLKYLDSAKNNIVEILEYITRESGSLVIGQHFVGLLRQKCQHLAGLPGNLGRVRPELRPDIRSFAFRGYVIFFRYIGDDFEVVNILEGHRELEHYFDDET